MTNRLVLFVFFGALTGGLLATPAAAQCTSANVNDPSPQHDSCGGGNPNELAFTRKTFSMGSSVSCSQGGYVGTSFGPQNSNELTAGGNCGNAPGSAPPDCAGDISGAFPWGFTGNAYRWTVYTTPAVWNGSGCDYYSPSGNPIETYAESCSGSFCCQWEDECLHLAGNWNNCECYLTPIILGLDGRELRLTDGRNGVLFDLMPDGIKEQVAWTRAGSTDGFLALDRNANGTIDDGHELFGSAAVQPPIQQRNGFNALLPFDLNADKVIDEKDPVFALLRVWSDTNHNGVSEQSELKSLSDRNVVSIALDYQETKRTDPHGNGFKFVSAIRVKSGKKIVERQAWDVVLVSAK